MIYIILLFIFLLVLILYNGAPKRKQTVLAGTILGAILLFIRLIPATFVNGLLLLLPFIQYINHNAKAQNKKTTASAEKNMTKELACEILQVNANATKQEIQKAYKRMILKNHPDHGGSGYIADQIIKAKKVLMDDKL